MIPSLLSFDAYSSSSDESETDLVHINKKAKSLPTNTSLESTVPLLPPQAMPISPVLEQQIKLPSLFKPKSDRTHKTANDTTRKRLYNHIDGQWPLSIYLPLVNNIIPQQPPLLAEYNTNIINQVSQFQKFYKSDFVTQQRLKNNPNIITPVNLHTIEPFSSHISLSRPQSLHTHEKGLFISSIAQKLLQFYQKSTWLHLSWSVTHHTEKFIEYRISTSTAAKNVAVPISYTSTIPILPVELTKVPRSVEYITQNDENQIKLLLNDNYTTMFHAFLLKNTDTATIAKNYPNITNPVYDHHNNPLKLIKSLSFSQYYHTILPIINQALMEYNKLPYYDSPIPHLSFAWHNHEITPQGQSQLMEILQNQPKSVHSSENGDDSPKRLQEGWYLVPTITSIDLVGESQNTDTHDHFIALLTHIHIKIGDILYQFPILV